MRKTIITFAALTFFVAGTSQATPKLPLVEAFHELSVFPPANLIDWKVGDKLEYKITSPVFGDMGTMVKSVTKEDLKQDAIWVKNEMKVMGRDEVVETLIRRSDAKILKMVRNGREEKKIPDNKLDIISQEFTKVTVPAGTFDCVKITAKSKQISKIEIWGNPQATAMDGAIKQKIKVSGIDLVFELTKFTKIKNKVKPQPKKPQPTK